MSNPSADGRLVSLIEGAVGRNLRDFVAAHHRLFPGSGADCIDVAGGVAAFTGVGSPLTTVKGLDGQLGSHHLDEIETFFRDHKSATVTIELAPWLSKRSKELLGSRGYTVVGLENVVATITGHPHPPETAGAERVPLHAWLRLMKRGSDLPNVTAINELVTAAAHLPNADFYGIRKNGGWIACAEAVTYDDVVIFGNDATVPEARGQGAQTALINHRLSMTPPAKIAIAEVAPDSGSERNYLRCGFHVAYGRTLYARRLTGSKRSAGPADE